MSARERIAAAGRIARRAVEYEALMWISLFRWVSRRPVTREPGAQVFGYARTVTPVLLAFIGVSVIEVPILDFLLPWPTVRIIALAAGVYGVLWMLGLLASLRVNPHIVADSGLRIRGSGGLDVTIPWELIASIRATDRQLRGKDRQVDRSGPGVIQHLGVMKQTNVDVVFTHPTIVELPSGDTEPLSELRFAADDPSDVVAAARHFLAAPRGRVTKAA